MSVRLLIYKHTSHLYRYKWCLHNDETGEDTYFDYSVTVLGARLAGRRKNKRVMRKVRKDIDTPIRNEVIQGSTKEGKQ